MFLDIAYLKTGSEKQREVFEAIRKLGIMHDLREYQPILCGTIPIGIDVESSDLDIILEVCDFERFNEKVRKLYGEFQQFNAEVLQIRGVRSVVVNFHYNGFEWELFAQCVPVVTQNAYVHMVVEHELLNRHPHVRDEIVRLKKAGMKTEPAFCQVFRIEGDPYEQLIHYGKKNDII